MVPQAQRGYSKSTEDEIEKYKEMVNTFSKNVDGSDTLQLPASLTSYVRLQIHEYAATIPGITHGSEGEGKSRHIVIRRVAKKKPKPAENTEPPMEKDKKANNQSDVEGAVVMAEATSDVVATAPTTVVPEEDKSRKPQKKTQKQQQQQQQPKKKAKGPKESFPANASKPKKAGPVKAVAKTKGMDEIDAALAELKIDTDTEHCAYRDSKTKKRCQQKVTLIYATCRYCNKKFCYAHVQAEVHGCGAAAKRLARAQVKEQYNEMTKYKKLAEKKGIY